MALIIAGVIIVGTALCALLQLFAAGMSDAPGAPSGAGWTLAGGFALAGLVAASHFLPHIGW